MWSMKPASSGLAELDFTPVINEPDLEVSNLLITGKTTSDMDFYRESRLQLSDNLSVVSGTCAEIRSGLQ